MTSGPQFAHPALARIAAGTQLLTLQHAATATGMAPPFTALRYVDCSPEGIAALARQVQAGTESVAAAQDDFRQARSTVDHAWSGPARSAFDNRAAALETDYGTVWTASEKTAEAGARIAQSLDDLTASVANKAATIANQVYPASYAVAAGDRSVAALQLVNQACADVVALVRNANGEIPPVAAGLNGLTEPTPTPPQT